MSWREAVKLPDRATLVALLRQRRIQVLLAVLLLLVVFRAALPAVLRRVIVSQADAALVGRIELEDLDLSLLRGGVTLEGLSVHADERPPEPTGTGEAATAAEAAPPVFSADRLWVQISWLRLVLKTLDVEEFDLQGFAVRLDRAADGALVLPKPAPAETPAEAAEEAAADEPSSWSLVVSEVSLLDGRIGFRDFVVGDPPQEFEIAIDDLAGENVAIQIDPSGSEPGTASLEARIQGGTVKLDAQLETLATGPAVDARIQVAGLPIGGARVYLPDLGWRELAGRLDADIRQRFEIGGAHRISGTVELGDVAVTVPELDAPALAWKRLAVTLGSVDLVAQRAEVSDVTLEGASLVLDPKSPAPVRALGGPRSAAPADTGSAPAEAETAPAAEAAPGTPSPWTWQVDHVALREMRLAVLGGAEPVAIGVTADVSDIASAPGTRSPVTLSLTQDAGSVALEGGFTIDPPSFEGKLRIADLALAPLAGTLDAPGVGLLRGGAARAELEITLAPPPGDLRIAGTLGLAGLEVNDGAAKTFSAAWKDFELVIRELLVPGVLAAAGAEQRAPIQVVLDRFRLVQPAILVTRTETGIVIPELGPAGAEPPAAAEAEPPAAAEAEPAPAESPPAPPAVSLRVARAAVERGRVQVVDRSVKPFYRGVLDPIELRATELRWPGPYAKSLSLDAKGLDGATLAVRGSLDPKSSKITTTLEGLPLAPFNPYASATGYGIGGGAASLQSEVELHEGDYTSKSKIVLAQLQMGGSEGEALFAQRFGVPLSVALALMKDLEGNISLTIPVAGDRSGMQIGLGKIVGEALARAILGAITSPLKLVAAVTEIGGKVQSIAPQPIQFAPGKTEPAESEEAKLTAIASLLGASPGLQIHLRGEAAQADQRFLQEEGVRLELERTSGVVGALQHIGERSARQAARAYFEARAAGTPAEIPAEPQAWFEAKVAEQTVDPVQLSSLAEARAVEVETRLVRDQGVAAQRLVRDPVSAEPLAAEPQVAIGIGAATAPAPAPAP